MREREMVRQVRAGYAIAGLEIKVPQTFIGRLMRATIVAHTISNNRLINQIHAAAPATPVLASDVDAFAAIVDAWITSDYHKVISEKITFDFVHVRSMEGLVVPQATVANTTVGDKPNDPLPWDKTLPVEFLHYETGPGHHGMFYPFAPSENENDALGKPTATYITLVTNTVQALVDNITAGGYTPAIASYTYYDWHEIYSILVRARWGSQRKRLTQYGT